MGLSVMAPPPVPAAVRLPVEPPTVARPHCLDAGERRMEIPAGGGRVTGTLAWPCHPSGFVLIVRSRQGKGAGLRDLSLARQLRADGLGALVLDESIGHQAEPLVTVTGWLAKQPEAADLPLGYLAIGAGAAALAATGSGGSIRAVVACGGGTDRLGRQLSGIPVPTLVIVRDGGTRQALVPTASTRTGSTRSVAGPPSGSCVTW